MPSGLQVYTESGDIIYDSSVWRYLRHIAEYTHSSVSTSRYAYYKELIVTYDVPAYDAVACMLFDQGSNKLIRGTGAAMTWQSGVSFFGLNLTEAQAIARIKPLILIGF